MAKGGGAQTQTTTSEPWKAQQPYLQSIFQTAEQLSQKPLQAYQGDTFAGKTGYDQTSQQQILAAGQTGQGIANQAVNALPTGLNAPDVANNSYVQNAIAAGMTPVIQNFTRQIMPSIRSGASSAGQYGSTRQAIVEGNAINDLTRNLADTAQQAEMQAYDTGMRSYLQTLGLMPSMQQMQTFQGNLTSQVGAQERAFEQQKINDALQKWNFQQMEPWQRLGMFKDAVGGNYGGTATSTTSGGGQSTAAGILGGGATGLMTYGLLAANPVTAPFAVLGGLASGAGSSGLF